MIVPKLRRCPFCGRKPKIQDLGQIKILSCEFSGCMVHPRICYTWQPEKEQDAIRAWNNRPLFDAIQKKVQEIYDDGGTYDDLDALVEIVRIVMDEEVIPDDA